VNSLGNSFASSGSGSTLGVTFADSFDVYYVKVLSFVSSAVPFRVDLNISSGDSNSRSGKP